MSICEKKVEEDYETILSNLADDINKRQLQLSEIRLRERRATLLVTLYTLAAWVAYLVIWYLNALPGLNSGHNSAMERVIRGIPIIVGPVVLVPFFASYSLSDTFLFSVLFIRRIVQIWYMRKGDGEGTSVFNFRFDQVTSPSQYREGIERVDQATTREGRGHQKEDKLLFHA